MELKDDKNGKPCLQIASRSFKGMILGFLSKVPLVKNSGIVTRYLEDIRASNARVLGVFIRALANCYGEAAADEAITRKKLDLSGNTPLTDRKLVQLYRAAAKVNKRLKADADAGSPSVLAYKPAASIDSSPRPATRAAANVGAANICGFSNLGNTGYANSTLKFLMFSIGVKRLVGHLQNLKEASENIEKRDCAEGFLELIRKSIGQEENVDEELRVFFKKLQTHPVFNKVDVNGNYVFKIIGKENDAQEFLAKILEIFELNEIVGHSAMIETSWKYNGLERGYVSDSGAAFYQNVNVSDSGLSLQGIINKMVGAESGVEIKWRPENVQATQIKRLVVEDMEKFNRFNLHVNAMEFDVLNNVGRKLELKNVSFDSSVWIPVFDKHKNQTWEVQLKPQEVVIHQEDASMRHYYIYSKPGSMPGWIKHDDGKVSPPITKIPDGEQVKLISFAVVGMRLLD